MGVNVKQISFENNIFIQTIFNTTDVYVMSFIVPTLFNKFSKTSKNLRTRSFTSITLWQSSIYVTVFLRCRTKRRKFCNPHRNTYTVKVKTTHCFLGNNYRQEDKPTSTTSKLDVVIHYSEEHLTKTWD